MLTKDPYRAQFYKPARSQTEHTAVRLFFEFSLQLLLKQHSISVCRSKRLCLELIENNCCEIKQNIVLLKCL